MFWRVAHHTIKWAGAGLFSLVTFVVLATLAAAAVWPAAKTAAETEFARIIYVLTLPWVWALAFLFVASWVAALIWTGHRAGLYHPQGPPAIQERKQAAAPRERKGATELAAEEFYRHSRTAALWGGYVAPHVLLRDQLEAELKQRPVPNLPVTGNSLGAYVRGFPRVRRVTAKIVSTLGEQISPDKEIGNDSYVEMALALGFTTILEIDAALDREEELVVRIAAYFIPNQIRSDFSLNCLFMVIGGRMGADAYHALGKSLKHWSNSRSFAEDLEGIYGQITSY